MAGRASWKGYLKLSLVSCPVKLFPATSASAGKISFNLLHKDTLNRVQQKYHDPELGEIDRADLVKGYQFEKDKYVVVTAEELDEIEVESSKTIDIDGFVDANDIDPIYYDSTYYLAPDGPIAAEAFAVMREGMKGKAGIGKLALYGREYLVAVRPQEKGLVMYTLHHAAEIRDISQIEELESVPTQVKPQEMKLAKQVIETFDAELNLKEYKDEYKEGLMEIIQAKIEGREVVAPAVEAPPKVVNLMEALRKSLDAVSTSKKSQAKVEEPKRTAQKAAAEPKAQAEKKRRRA
jgi:DNA end-binding protein Ku